MAKRHIQPKQRLGPRLGSYLSCQLQIEHQQATCTTWSREWSFRKQEWDECRFSAAFRHSQHAPSRQDRSAKSPMSRCGARMAASPITRRRRPGGPYTMKSEVARGHDEISSAAISLAVRTDSTWGIKGDWCQRNCTICNKRREFMSSATSMGAWICLTKS